MEHIVLREKFAGQTLDDIWHVFSRLNCMFEYFGLPAYDLADRPNADGTYNAYAADARRGRNQRLWREVPTTWITNECIEMHRLFDSGSVAQFKLRIEFNPDDELPKGEYGLLAAGMNALADDECLVRFTIDAEAAGMSARGCKHFVNELIRSIDTLCMHFRAYFRGTITYPFPRPSEAFRPLVNTTEMLEHLKRSPYTHGYVDALNLYVMHGLESEVSTIRPVDLSRLWGFSEREAMELCLAASKAGLLSCSWRVICPRTMKTVLKVNSLDKLPKSIRSPWFGGVYSRNFARNVEASFTVHPQVRNLSGGSFCSFSPAAISRVKAQFTLGPQQSAKFVCEEGAYRMQILHKRADFPFDIYAGYRFEELIYDEIKFSYDANTCVLSVINLSKKPATYLVSNMNSNVNGFFAASKAINSQALRDIFPTDILHPEDEAAMGNVTVMFTDLRASTQMYEAIGDARAFHLVRQHFDVLLEMIRQHNGALVKTIGDAVMAVFENPADAVRVAMGIQERMELFNKQQVDQDIILKISIHSGPCIAVTLNNRIDYFGATVNTAARLSEVSKGDDIVMSLPVVAHAEVNRLLSLYKLTSQEDVFKGIDGELAYVTLCRQEVVEKELQKGEFNFLEKPSDDKEVDDTFFQSE